MSDKQDQLQVRRTSYGKPDKATFLRWIKALKGARSVRTLATELGVNRTTAAKYVSGEMVPHLDRWLAWVRQFGQTPRGNGLPDRTAKTSDNHPWRKGLRA